MKKNITFVFNEGRAKRIEKDTNGPKEFFYSYNFFQKDNQNTNLIELQSKKKGGFYFFFKLIRKISKIPIYTEGLIDKDNLKVLFHSKSLIATNQNIGYSLLPLLKISRNNEIKFYTFIMGFLQNSRKNIFNNLILLNYEIPSFIAKSANLSKNSSIGSGTILMRNVIVNSNSSISDNCIINNNALIEHDVVISSNCHISTGAIVNGNVTIDKNTFIGSGAIIKEGVKIGKSCIIGAGNIIKKDIISGSIVY